MKHVSGLPLRNQNPRVQSKADQTLSESKEMRLLGETVRGPFEHVNMHKNYIQNRSNPIRPFELRSNYVRIAFNYVQLRSKVCKYYIIIT